MGRALAGRRNAAAIRKELAAAFGEVTDLTPGTDPGDGGEGEAVNPLAFKAFIATALGEPAAADITDPDIAGLPAWMEQHGEVLKAANAAATTSQKARSTKYGIGIKDGGAVTMPSQWKEAGCTDDDFLDPVNYRYPCHDASHTRNAASRYAGNKDAYTAAEQGVIAKRLAAKEKKFNIAQETSGKFKEQVDRQKLAGIKVYVPDAECPPELKAYEDEPQAWGDFTNYQFPCATLELVARSLGEFTAETDRDPFERTMVFTKLSSAQQLLELEERLSKALAAVPGTPAPEANTGDLGTDPTPGDPAPAEAVHKDFTYSTRWAIRDLCDAFVQTLSGVDTLSEASGGPGLQQAQAGGLLGQLSAGIQAVLDGAALSVEENTGVGPDTTGEMIYVEFNADLREAVTKAAPDLAGDWITRAGRRTSASTMKALGSAHQGIVDAGFDGCMPADAEKRLVTTTGVKSQEGQPQTDDEAQTRIRTLEAELQKARTPGADPDELQKALTEVERLRQHAEDLEVRHSDLETRAHEDADTIARLEATTERQEKKLRGVVPPDPFERRQMTESGDLPAGAKTFTIPEDPDSRRLPYEQEQRFSNPTSFGQ